jgi:hypothetical protein
MSRRRTFRAIKDIAERYGYTFDGKTANNHLRWVHPTKPMIITISKESDTRSFKNAEGLFSRYNQAGKVRDGNDGSFPSLQIQ